jgi:hypothetical protein
MKRSALQEEHALLPRNLRYRYQPPRDEPEETRDPLNEKITILKGFQISKLFDDGLHYDGVVTSTTPRMSDGELLWLVLYEDGDEEEMTRSELSQWAASKPRRQSPRAKAARVSDESSEDQTSGTDELIQFDESLIDKDTPTVEKPVNEPWASREAAQKDLCFRMGVTKEEVVAALDSMDGPPYKLNLAMKIIHERKAEAEYKEEKVGEKFSPYIGMKVRKTLGGYTWNGEVTKDWEYFTEPDTLQSVKMWEVTFDDDGDVEHMDFQQLLECRASRPMRHHPVRGRQVSFTRVLFVTLSTVKSLNFVFVFGKLTFLELFSGCGVVTQEFCDRRWRVRSVDNDPTTFPTDRVDFTKLTFDSVGPTLPDCIWMSPPCFTYSNMAGGKHRSAPNGEFEKTPEARLHNTFLTRMNFLMGFVRRYKPHAIFIIENPVGALSKMPLMEKMVESFGLYMAVVNYCALGREDKKATCLWTNDFDLWARLSYFRCKPSTCPYYEKVHPVGVRSHGNDYNAAAIPQALAEETAACVDHAFYSKRIPHTAKEVVVTKEMISEFNHGMNDDELTNAEVGVANDLS